MFKKKLIAVMTAAVIGMAMYGGSASAFAHEGHDHDGTVSPAGSEEEARKGELCPVSGEKVDATTAISYDYKGKVYHFCCASCFADFKKDPEKYIGKMRGEGATAEPMHHGDHGHD